MDRFAPPHPLPSDAESYLRDIFAAQSARTGGVIRRKVRDVERMAGREMFLGHCRARGFRVIENNGHFIMLCNRAPVVVHD